MNQSECSKTTTYTTVRIFCILVQILADSAFSDYQLLSAATTDHPDQDVFCIFQGVSSELKACMSKIITLIPLAGRKRGPVAHLDTTVSDMRALMEAECAEELGTSGLLQELAGILVVLSDGQKGRLFIP